VCPNLSSDFSFLDQEDLAGVRFPKMGEETSMCKPPLGNHAFKDLRFLNPSISMTTLAEHIGYVDGGMRQSVIA
jgi:hypothetical protein